jgi:hypothetical protein
MQEYSFFSMNTLMHYGVPAHCYTSLIATTLALPTDLDLLDGGNYTAGLQARSSYKGPALFAL